MSIYSPHGTKAKWQPSITSILADLLQRQCACGQHTIASGECAECRQKREGTMQRSAVNSVPTNAVPPIVHDVLNSPGQPLDTGTRAFMEPRFGHDFSSVRVHTDARAAESTRSVNALAYTVGRNVVFGTGQYAPGTSEGQRLLAHELTHVVQQSSAPSSTDATIKPGTPGDSYEREADLYASHIAHEGSRPTQMSAHHTGISTIMQRAGGAGTTQSANPSGQPAPGGTSPTSGGPPAQIHLPFWTPDLLSISLGDGIHSGTVTRSGPTLYSNTASPITMPPCQSEYLPFSVTFFVDRPDALRPKSFNMPGVGVNFDFRTTSGKQTTNIHKFDATPSHNTPFADPHFGSHFRMEDIDESGKLSIRLTMDDSLNSGVTLTYIDVVEFKAQPCTWSERGKQFIESTFTHISDALKHLESLEDHK
jgi:hypothetical protein